MPQISEFYQEGLTLPDILKRSAHSPRSPYIGFVNEKYEETVLPYSELLNEASAIAIGLSNEGLVPGDKVIIATSNNRETLVLLWGCFLLGVIPTILQPVNTFTGYNPPVVKLLNVNKQLDSPLVFMSSIPDSADDPELNYKLISQLNTNGVLPEIKLDPHSVAFIQFSSGSTGDPKGIMLTHNNLMVNLEAIRIGLNLHESDSFGNWMPLFHDMGLIGYHLGPIFTVIPQWQIETIDFIKNPGLWLDLLSKHKIQITGCPNFGLALSLRHIKRMKNAPDWDFSALRSLLNGAEPISVQIMNDFIKELMPYNFRDDSMMPVYGLAEATLAATFTPSAIPPIVKAFDAQSLDKDNRAIEVDGSLHEHARLISSVGVCLNDINIKITDNDFNEVEEGRAGVIWIKGASVTQGYYNRLKETDQDFRDGWFCTGDVGFIYKGYYYISGRQKDIIFKNGRHYFANDLEEIASCIDGVSYGKICFTGMTNHTTGKEEIIAFLAGSPGPKAEEIFIELRNILRSTLGITPDKLVMVRSNEIPKTSSGKLQRYKLLQRYKAGEFSPTTILDEVSLQQAL